MQIAVKDVCISSTRMSEAGHLKRRQQQTSEHTNKNPGSEVSQIPPKHGSIQRLAQSSRPSEQSLLRSLEHEAEQTHEEHTTGFLCLILAKFPHLHWSKY
ncbi:hypothetical protein QC760_009239 [Botrytis cinerea]